jgi:threonine dehydrogenase-like Zn-dependent dehydrogenase
VQAIALVPGTTTLRLVDRPEAHITGADEIKVQTVQVGICGTDREEAAGGRAEAPPGQNELIIGHEMIGRVVALGRLCGVHRAPRVRALPGLRREPERHVLQRRLHRTRDQGP